MPATKVKKNTNIVILATHGGCTMPDSIQKKLTDRFSERLLKNFSDFATKHILPQNIPSDQTVVANFSRALGDPNRSIESGDLFRDHDFGGNQIWAEPLTQSEKKQLIEDHYDFYHSQIINVLNEVESKNDCVLVLDIHDTGQLLLGETLTNDCPRSNDVPLINLGNKNGTSCSPELMNKFTALIEKHFGINPTINEPYKGGFITTKYGKEHNESLPEDKKYKRNVIQVEFNRSLYMNEQEQMVDEKRTQKIRENLESVLSELFD